MRLDPTLGVRGSRALGFLRVSWSDFLTSAEVALAIRILPLKVLQVGIFVALL